jgi:hypothetical protein
MKEVLATIPMLLISRYGAFHSPQKYWRPVDHKLKKYFVDADRHAGNSIATAGSRIMWDDPMRPPQRVHFAVYDDMPSSYFSGLSHKDGLISQCYMFNIEKVYEDRDKSIEGTRILWEEMQ